MSQKICGYHRYNCNIHCPTGGTSDPEYGGDDCDFIDDNSVDEDADMHRVMLKTVSLPGEVNPPPHRCTYTSHHPLMLSLPPSTDS